MLATDIRHRQRNLFNRGSHQNISSCHVYFFRGAQQRCGATTNAPTPSPSASLIASSALLGSASMLRMAEAHPHARERGARVAQVVKRARQVVIDKPARGVVSGCPSLSVLRTTKSACVAWRSA